MFAEIATISDLASDFVQLWVGAAGNLFVLYCPRKLLGRLEKLALATGIVLQSVDLTLFYEHVYKTLFKSIDFSSCVLMAILLRKFHSHGLVLHSYNKKTITKSSLRVSLRSKK